MQKLVNIKPHQPNLAIISNNKNLFYEELKQKIHTLTEDDFYKWIVEDINFCYLLLWLHPVTSVRLFGTQSKVINMTSRHDYDNAIRQFKRYWPNYKLLINAMFERFEFILRIQSDNIFSRYRSKYEKDIYSHAYLKLKLPFECDRSIVSKYDLELNKNNDVRRVIVQWEPSPTHPIIHTVAHRLVDPVTHKIKLSMADIHRRGFVPYGLYFVYEELKDVIPFELFRLCVLYYLDNDSKWTVKLENRIL